MKRLLLVLSDDWELRGNGSGEVAAIQYKPAIRLMDLYDEFGIRSTFNIEILQQLAFNRHAALYREIGEAKECWEKTVCIMRERGFDIQLHIHPQWYGASYDGNIWQLNQNWNIGDYQREIIQSIVSDCIRYVDSFLSGGFKPIAFRGGSWGAYPSRNLFEVLESAGIQFDTSIVNNLYIDSKYITLDYRYIESPYFPYYPDYDDIRRISELKVDIVEIPTQTFKVDVFGKLLRNICKLFNKRNHTRKKSQIGYPKRDSTLQIGIVADPRGVENTRRKHSEAIFDLSNLDICLMKYGIARILNRALAQSTPEVIPIVLTNHTKDLDDQKIIEIRAFLGHVTKKYSDSVEFVTMAQLYNYREFLAPRLKKIS
jgi:hypothetical protein